MAKNIINIQKQMSVADDVIGKCMKKNLLIENYYYIVYNNSTFY